MVGNDIVDLSDPDSSFDAHHSRFDRRAFTTEEFEALSIEYTDVQRRSILWSAKEAAYKAARREDAGIVFSPVRFVVDLDRSLSGSVAIGYRLWPVRVRIAGDCVHAVVSENPSFEGILSGARRLTAAELRDPSQEVRRFAIESIAAEFGVGTSELEIEKADRIPSLVVAGEAAPAALSLSHHGSYVGFACQDWRFGQDRRLSRRIARYADARATQSPLDRESRRCFADRPEAARSGSN